MAYDNQDIYNKHQSDGCSCSGECNCGNSEDCGCCPAGLVSVFDDCGKHAGCLTPNDAEEYNTGKLTCAEGYVKFFHPVTNKFMGCISTEDALLLLTALTP